MAALDFPSSPTTGQVYSANGKSWAYDGASWIAQSGAPRAASFVGASAYASATQSIANNTNVALTFNTESYDTAAIHDTGSNTSRFTVPAGQAGYWAGVGGTGYANNTTGVRYLFWQKNGVDVPGSIIEIPAANTGVLSMYLIAPLPPTYASPGDYFELVTVQTSGGALNAGANSVSGLTATASLYKVDGIVGGGTPSGTSFPATPGTGQQFFRTDLGLECYYDGTRWLTKNEYAMHFSIVPGVTVPATATQVSLVNGATDFSQAGMWITRAIFQTYVLATNNGSNYWAVQLFSQNAAGSNSNLGASFNTSADTAAVTVTHTVTVAAAVNSGDKVIAYSITKISSPGNMYALPAVVYYRLIVT